MRLPDVKIATEYVAFAGGIDRVSPALAIKPGFVIDAMNYEHGLNGGYPRIDGFERTDGRAAPSAGVYYWAGVSLTGTLQAGSGVVGATSGATAVVAALGTGVVSMTRVVGTFVSGETLTAGGGSLPLLIALNNQPRVVVGTLTTALVRGGAPTAYDDAVSLAAAADIYRALIDKVPGDGSVRGVNMLKGVLYAFRDNVSHTACQMWKATANGWAIVPLGLELAFTAGGSSPIAEGDTVTGATSGATAVVKRVVLESGTFAGSTAAGRLIFAAQTGTFQAETLKVGATNVATIAGDASAITLLPGGRFEIVNYNFTGSTDTLRMYGCDLVNRGFESDGTTFVPIRTGMAVDTPTHVWTHKKQLFFSFRGSSQNSGIGLPYQWTAVTGASEIGIGDDITGYASQTGDVLAIFARNRSDQLSGSSVSNFVLTPLSDKAGAVPYTIQTLGSTFYLDDQGVRQITRTQDYGSFNDTPVSTLVQPIIDLMRGKAVASSVYRARSQYRIYANDGSGVIVSLGNRLSQFGGMVQVVQGITTFQYPVNVTCTYSGEDATGKDVVFFGADNGYVYQADKGSSFDGVEIEHYLRPAFNHSKSPRTRKRYRKVVMEMTSIGYSAIRVSPEFSYGNDDAAPHRMQTAEVLGIGDYWDSGTWEQFIWDGPLVSAPEFSIEGTGTNMGLLFYGKSKIDLGHTLQGVTVHFTPRRLAR